MDRISVILVEPKSAGNVGAAARALHNMGLSRLTLVGGASTEEPEARMMAVGALEVLRGAGRADSLEDAVAGAGLTVATTRRAGKHRGPVVDIRQAAEEVVRAAASGNRVALVFGREDSGLTTAELDACHILARIPTAPEYPSLNLAQAVLMAAYEIWRAADVAETTVEHRLLATAGETEALFGELGAVLEEIGFLNPQNPQEIMHAIRRMLGRAGMEPREVKILRGIIRQIRWAASQPPGEYTEKPRS